MNIILIIYIIISLLMDIQVDPSSCYSSINYNRAINIPPHLFLLSQANIFDKCRYLMIQ